MSSSYSRFALLLCFATFCANAVRAAENPTTSSPTQADAALQSYISNRGTSAGRDTLRKIRSKGPEPTASNISLVRQALATKSSAEERVLLVSILGGLYDHHSDRAGQNANIKNDLKRLAYTEERDTARAAVFAISRIGGDDELASLLRHARNKTLIDNDEYAGELAHNIRFAAISRQAEQIILLGEAKSAYGIDVLTSELGNAAFVRKIPAENLKRIGALLAKSEPNFPLPIGELGIVDAARYASWLHARALLSEVGGRTQYTDFIIAELNFSKTDPRKILGYLTSNEAEAFLGKVNRSRIDPALQRVRSFTDSFPQNPIIQDLAIAVFAKTSKIPK